MAGISRTNADLVALGAINSNGQLAVYKIDTNSAMAADTQAGGAGTAITQDTAGNIARALNAYIFEPKSDGDYAIAVVDNHANDADSVKARVDDILNVSNTTVTKLTTLLSL